MPDRPPFALILSLLVLGSLVPPVAADGPPPTFALIHQGPFVDFRVVAHDDRLYFFEGDGPGTDSDLFSTDADGQTILHLVAASAGNLAFTAEGWIVRHSGAHGVALDRAGILDPLFDGNPSVAFGPDALYASDGFEPRAFVRLRADRTLDEIRDPAPQESYADIVAAPDGELYASALGRETLRLDFDAGTATPVPGIENVGAFDASGRAYLITGRTVERVDPATGARAIVARSDHRIFEIALTSDRIFATILAENGMAIGVVPLDGPGFSGFEPAFDVVPAPNLRPTAFEHIEGEVELAADGALVRVNVLRVTIVNDGGSAARDFDVEIVRQCTATCYTSGQYFLAHVEGIEAGGSVTLDFAWDSIGSLGDQRFDVWADVHSDIVEANEEDQHGLYDAHVAVEGNRALCLSLDPGPRPEFLDRLLLYDPDAPWGGICDKILV